jgi:hypothetical protein
MLPARASKRFRRWPACTAQPPRPPYGATAKSPTPYWATRPSASAATRKPATPAPGSQNLAYGSYDCGCDSETGYADAGERYRCLDCGSTGDVDDAAPALAMLAQEPRKPMTIAHSAAELPDVA